MGKPNYVRPQHFNPKAGTGEAVRRTLALLDGKAVLESTDFVPRSTREGESKWFVGGLDWDTTEGDLRSFVASANVGRVVELHLFLDQFSKKSRGFAILRCVGDPTVLNGKTLQGRPITVTPWQG
jgi:RNA recognition motif. (a.k.a. RRM, RBD, or RNP domain)